MSTLNQASLLSMASLPATLEVRQMIEQLVDVQNEEYTMFDYLNFKGQVANIPVGNVEYFHFLNSSLYATAEVKTDYVAQAAGVTASVTILASAGVTPLVNETVVAPNGVQGLITAVSAATDPVLTIKVPTGVIFPALADGDKLIFPSNAYGEGAGTSSVMRQSPITKRSNYVQKFKTFVQESDLSAATEIELKFKGKNYIFFKQQYEAMRKHELDIANAGYIGAKSNNMTDANGNLVHTTEGLRNAIINGGGIQHSTAGGTFSPLVDLLSMSIQMDAARCPKDYDMWASQSYDNAVDVGTANTSAFSGGGISYGAYNGNDQIDIALGTKELSMFGYRIKKKRFAAAQHSQLYAATGYTNFLKEAYLIPADKVKTHASNGERVDRIRVRYLGYHGDFSKSRYREVFTGGLVPQPTDNRDVFEVTYSSQQGFEFVGTEHFVKSTL